MFTRSLTRKILVYISSSVDPVEALAAKLSLKVEKMLSSYAE